MARKVVGTNLGPLAAGASFIASLTDALRSPGSRLYVLNTAGGSVGTYGGPLLIEFRDSGANVVSTVLGNVLLVPIPETAIDCRVTNTHGSVATGLFAFDVIVGS